HDGKDERGDALVPVPSTFQALTVVSETGLKPYVSLDTTFTEHTAALAAAERAVEALPDPMEVFPPLKRGDPHLCNMCHEPLLPVTRKRTPEEKRQGVPFEIIIVGYHVHLGCEQTRGAVFRPYEEQVTANVTDEERLYRDADLLPLRTMSSKS